MTKLDERTMEDMTKLLLDRTAVALSSVLQLMDDPIQRAEMIVALGTLCTALTAKIFADTYRDETGNTVPFEAAVRLVLDEQAHAAIEMGEDAADLGLTKMHSMVN